MSMIFNRFLIDVLNDFRWIPTAPTLDPLENFRVARGSRHFWRLRELIEKRIPKLTKNPSQINEKSTKKWLDFLIDF